MLATGLIVFREVLEAALIISIVMAASRGVQGRGAWIGTGLLAGLFLSCVVAFFAGHLATAAAGVGQDLFNAIVLLSAVFLLGWHNIWMQQHGRELAREMRQLGLAVVSGSRPLYALATVVGLAVLREGSELVLFLYGVLSSGEGTGDLLLGGLMGLAVGVSTGFALYLGLLRIPHRRLFAVTSGLILFLAAGLSAQAAASLVQADLIPPLGRTVWDTSSLLPEDSLFGRLLHVLVGYVAQPDGIQILFYLITLSVIFIMMQVCRLNPTELKGKS
ncbi:MAG: hypothetical protein RLZZ226_1735 [Pseudomonadota bacterium]